MVIDDKNKNKDKEVRSRELACLSRSLDVGLTCSRTRCRDFSLALSMLVCLALTLCALTSPQLAWRCSRSLHCDVPSLRALFSDPALLLLSVLLLFAGWPISLKLGRIESIESQAGRKNVFRSENKACLLRRALISDFFKRWLLHK